MSALSDIEAILGGDGIRLDKWEAAQLGAPSGETISMWDALVSRHGSLIASIGCIGLWLVQFQHCKKQLAHQPMAAQNYVRAAFFLVLAAPFVILIGEIRRIKNG